MYYVSIKCFKSLRYCEVLTLSISPRDKLYVIQLFKTTTSAGINTFQVSLTVWSWETTFISNIYSLNNQSVGKYLAPPNEVPDNLRHGNFYVLLNVSHISALATRNPNPINIPLIGCQEVCCPLYAN